MNVTVTEAYLRRVPKASRRTMERCVANLADLARLGEPATAKWETLDNRRVLALVSRLQKAFAPASVGKHLSALRGLFREARVLGRLDDEPRVPVVDVTPRRERPTVSPANMSAMLRVCEADPARALGRRDAALLALLYGAGLHRREVVAIDLDTYDGRSLRLSDRAIPLDPSITAVLDEWTTARGSAPGPFLCAIAASGEVEVRRLSDQAIFYAVRRRAEEAGLGQLSPSDFRHAFIEQAIRYGSLHEAQRLAGHASPTTTARYQRAG